MLFAAVARWPYGYFVVLRWVATAAALVVARAAYKADQNWIVLPFGLVALLFNPIVPVHFPKAVWTLLDAVSGTIMLISVFVVPSDLFAPSVRRLRVGYMAGLIRALRYRRPDGSRDDAKEALAALGAPAIEPLLHLLTKQRPACSYLFLDDVTEIIGRMNASAVNALMAYLGDKRWGWDRYDRWFVRAIAAMALGNIGDKKAVKLLIPLLMDEAWEVQVAAARALGQLGDARAVGPLIAELSNVNNAEVQRWSLSRSENGEPDGVNNYWGVVDVRCHMADAMGKIGDQSAVEPLAGLLAEGNSEASVRAPAEAEAFARSNEARDDTSRWLVKPLEPRSIDVLVLSNKTSFSAAKALARLGDSRGQAHLTEVAGSSEVPSWLRQEAQTALEELQAAKDEWSRRQKNQ